MGTLQKSINQLKLHFILLAVALIISSVIGFSFAQKKPPPPPPESPSDCKTGCTSNDVQILTAYLVDAESGEKLDPTFQCQGSANVKLALELATNTPRIGVVIYANIKALVNGVPTGDALANPKECFSVNLNQPTNKVVFQQSFGWTCGTPIVLTDVFLGWGTGNTDFCEGDAAFRCPGTSSKCYQLPPGEYITIEIPTGQGASQTKCSSTPEGNTATFDLTESDETVKNGQQDVTVKWYSDAAGLNELTGTNKTAFVNTTNPQTVYAKVCNNADLTVCSGLQSVVLTVKPTPAAPILSKVDNCDGTTTITAKDANDNNISGSQLNWTGTSETGNPIVVNTTGAITATRTVEGCTSSASNSVTPAPGSAPSSPNLTYLAPACDEITFSVRVNSPTQGVTYSILDKDGNAIAGVKVGETTTSSYEAPNSNNFEFSNIPAGKGYQVTATSGNCSSDETSCGTPEEVASTRSQGSDVQENNVTTQEIIIPSSRKLGIKAFPNPYNDVIRFVINSEESGQGRLELFNMLGQKVKTVYQGNIAVGVQNYEVSVPAQHRSTLIYIMTLNGKQFTGKLLNSSK